MRVSTVNRYARADAQTLVLGCEVGEDVVDEPTSIELEIPVHYPMARPEVFCGRQITLKSHNKSDFSMLKYSSAVSKPSNRIPV